SSWLPYRQSARVQVVHEAVLRGDPRNGSGEASRRRSQRGGATPSVPGLPGGVAVGRRLPRCPPALPAVVTARCDGGGSLVTPPADDGDACSNLCSNRHHLTPTGGHRPPESRIFARFSDKRSARLTGSRSSQAPDPLARHGVAIGSRRYDRRVVGCST